MSGVSGSAARLYLFMCQASSEGEAGWHEEHEGFHPRKLSEGPKK